MGRSKADRTQSLDGVARQAAKQATASTTTAEQRKTLASYDIFGELCLLNMAPSETVHEHVPNP